ncbi:TauD/TfdA family dioxygenase [Phaeobacter sp. CNT1-3]|nr:TauD/TfdA family dioxygenase [Phaeobacter sp. CNT1-3]
MTQAHLCADTAAVNVTFDDGAKGTFPFLWLRDNDPTGFHPDTQERLTDLTAISLDTAVTDAAVDGDALALTFDDGAAVRYQLDWLAAHRPGHALADPAKTGIRTWRADMVADAVPRLKAADVLSSDAALKDWLVATQASGLSLIEGLPDDREAGMNVAKRIGFLRETNFGVTFEVKSKPNPNNLAYTPIALPLHTDLTNQELPPGFQFLHCLANEATGGGSLFSDGFAVAEDLRAEDPEAFELLSTISVPFRFHDGEYDIRSRKKVITLDEDGSLKEICFNAHIAGILDIAPEKMPAYYRAYRKFMLMSRAPAYLVTFKLQAGEMVIFDNRRVLHGREAFDPNTGARHLRGCYVDRGEFESRLRVLAR